jgi:AmmeMemoRadiSam system protein A
MAYDHNLTVDEQKELLRIARTTIKEYLLSGRLPPGAPHKKSLIAPAAVFVSLHEGETLRGCIGTPHESSPLYKAVQEMAVAAASRDPRYKPVKLDELPGLAIEVSVLGPRAAMKTTGDVVIGTHGVQVTSTEGTRTYRGLFLPKVAVEQAWDVETFLCRACEKAGLPQDFWKGREDHVEYFTAQVFDEKSLAFGPFATSPPMTPLE